MRVRSFRTGAPEVDESDNAHAESKERIQMLTVTPVAATAVSSLLENPQLPEGSSLRLQRDADSNGTGAIGIAIVDERQPGDQAVPMSDGELLLASDIADMLDGHVLDAEIDGEHMAFMIRPRSNDREQPG